MAITWRPSPVSFNNSHGFTFHFTHFCSRGPAATHCLTRPLHAAKDPWRHQVLEGLADLKPECCKNSIKWLNMTKDPTKMLVLKPTPNDITTGCVNMWICSYQMSLLGYVNMCLWIFNSTAIRVCVRKCGDIRMVETHQTVDAKSPPYC